MFEGIDLEKKVTSIVVDAVASHTGIEASQLERDTELDIDSMDWQDILMEIEEQCDQIPPIDKRNLRTRLPDSDIQAVHTIGGLIDVTLQTAMTLLSSSGDTET